MSDNTGGLAFPGTLLDWYAGQETIGDEELGFPICEHHAGPMPSGNWTTNPVGWHEWEARWRAGVKYTRAAAMLAEKARREAAVMESSTSADAGDTLRSLAADVLPADIRDAAGDEPLGWCAEQVRAHVNTLTERNRELLEALESVTNELHQLVKDERDDPSAGIVGWKSLHELVAEARAILAKQKGTA